MANATLTRFIGGSPAGVIARLVLVSILVGALLDLLGLDPLNLVTSLRAVAQRIWDMGFDAVEWLVRYLVLGAILVVPIWLILRLIQAPRGR